MWTSLARGACLRTEGRKVSQKAAQEKTSERHSFTTYSKSTALYFLVSAMDTNGTALKLNKSVKKNLQQHFLPEYCYTHTAI